MGHNHARLEVEPGRTLDVAQNGRWNQRAADGDKDEQGVICY